LRDGTHGAAIAILYGIGGVGKAAIAKTVYNQNFHKFEGMSFLKASKNCYRDEQEAK
jgi:replication-associated recombination protein RarA